MILPLGIAHRGFSARYPENTVTAIDAAIRAGADMVETDARTNADGEIFCVHDSDLRRLTGQPIAIADATTDALLAVELPGGERLMTLRDALTAIAGRAPVLIDVKTTGAAMVDTLLETVDAAGQMAGSWFGFRDLEQFRLARARMPYLRCVALLEDYAAAKAWLNAGAAAIRIWEGDFDRDIEARLGPLTPLWITAGGRKTPSRSGDIDEGRLAALATRRVAAVLLNDPTALTGLRRRPTA